MTPGLMLVALLVCPPPDEIPDRLAVPAVAVAAGPQRVSGLWTRDTEMTRMTFAFGESKLTVSFTFAPPPEAPVPGFTATLDADYTVSPEGVVYGVFTGGDAEPACAGAAVQLFAGHPFAFHARTAGGITTVRDVKFFGASVPSYSPLKREPKPIEEMTPAEAVTAIVSMTAGRYTPDDGAKRPMKKAAATATTAPAGMTLGVLGQVRGTNHPETITILPMSAPVPATPALPVVPALVRPLPSTPVPLVAPAGFLPAAPNVVGPAKPAERPPLLGGDVSPPPAKLGVAPTVVEQAVAAAMVQLGTDPGVPAYYEMAVKEQDGVSVTMTWTANTFVNRVYFDVQTAAGEGDDVVRERFKMSANFAQGKDDVFYGIVTGVDVHEGNVKELTKALTGALFKFTQKPVDGKTDTRDVVVLNAAGEKEFLHGIAEALAGKYVGSPGKPAGPPKPLPVRPVPAKATK